MKTMGDNYPVGCGHYLNRYDDDAEDQALFPVRRQAYEEGQELLSKQPSFDRITKTLNRVAIIAFLSLAALLMSTCSRNAFAEQIDLDKIAMIESSGNRLAWNKRDDSRGLYQITPICLKEFNNFHPYEQYTSEDLWSATINERIAKWYLTERIPSMLRYYKRPITTENIIVAYNAGISYLVQAKSIPSITKRYIEKYKGMK